MIRSKKLDELRANFAKREAKRKLKQRKKRNRKRQRSYRARAKAERARAKRGQFLIWWEDLTAGLSLQNFWKLELKVPSALSSLLTQERAAYAARNELLDIRQALRLDPLSGERFQLRARRRILLRELEHHRLLINRLREEVARHGEIGRIEQIVHSGSLTAKRKRIRRQKS